MDKTQFLKIIRQIESSGGKNTDHPEMTSGLHAGQAAVGDYGLMPKTMQEFINRRKQQGKFGPDESVMSQLNPEQLSEFVENNPRVEENLASDVAGRVLDRSVDDEQRAAFMWNQGHNKNPDDISEEDLQKSNYIKKFDRLKNLISKK